MSSTGGAEGPELEPRLRDGLRHCTVVFLAVRSAMFVLSAFGVGLVGMPPGQPTGVPGWAPPPMTAGWQLLFTATERQDALWFLRIATQGYRTTDTSAAFFPLYPAAIKLGSVLTLGHPLAAAILVANACFFGALLLLFDLTAREFSVPVARRTVVLIAIFPTAFFLLAPYSESLFLLLTVATFRFARRDRWGWAAAAALGAALTRSVGIALAPALLVEAALQARAGRPFLPRALVSLAPVAGLLAEFGYWSVRAGDALAPIHAQKAWRPAFSPPWATLWHGLLAASRYQSYWLLDALVVGAALVALAAGIRSVRASYLVYAAISLTLPLVAEYPGRPFLSMPRFVGVIFPLFWVPALAAQRRRWLETGLVAVFAGGFALFAVLFVNWQYIF